MERVRLNLEALEPPRPPTAVRTREYLMHSSKGFFQYLRKQRGAARTVYNKCVSVRRARRVDPIALDYIGFLYRLRDGSVSLSAYGDEELTEEEVKSVDDNIILAWAALEPTEDDLRVMQNNSFWVDELKPWVLVCFLLAIGGPRVHIVILFSYSSCRVFSCRTRLRTCEHRPSSSLSPTCVSPRWAPGHVGEALGPSLCLLPRGKTMTRLGSRSRSTDNSSAALLWAHPFRSACRHVGNEGGGPPTGPTLSQSHNLLEGTC
jgi:hypothetical protein